MRRLLYLVLPASFVTLLALWLGQPSPVPAQVGKKPLPANGVSSKGQVGRGPVLPVTKVVLFTSGVGYFEREGEVDGNATTDLTFPAQDINDLLKSLVLQDLGGGQIRVGYDSFDPVEKTLKSFALDLTKNPGYGQLLQQARGEKVEVDWTGQQLKGAVVGVEQQKQPVGKDQISEVQLLNLLTADGLRSLPLSQVQRVRFLNTHLEGELQRALEVLAFAHDTHKRTVSLQFTGEGKRTVRVGYVIENPIWKTSYRLVLDPQGQPFLQGWAIVDNATDDDWRNVQVTLVSGRPISFQMNLYQPLYVQRPWVELETFAHLRPPTYGGALESQARARDEVRRFEAKEARKEAGFAPAPPAAKALDLSKGVVAEAATGSVGDFFQYVIKQPVSLARQRSAMLPIVNQAIEGKRFSIYNAAVQAKHPLLGVKLKNSTNLHLMQGPITVFEGSSYAGDARIPDLQPNEERLLSYAVDQGVEVEPVAQSAPDELRTIKIVKGILEANYKLSQTTTFNAKNRATQERQLLVEFPFRPDWKLVSPEKAAERSREFYRLAMAVPVGKSVSQAVTEEQDRMNKVILTTADDSSIRLYLDSKVISPAIKEALGKAITLKNKLAETRLEIAQVSKNMQAIVEDQARIRANMERVPPNSAPHQRYLKKLDEQETQIEGFQAQLKQWRGREDEQRKDYENYVLGLTLE